MSQADRGWLSQGRGVRPQVTWAFTTDAPLVCLQLARETGEVLAADESGGIYLLDRSGDVVSLTRGPRPLRALAWSDTGQGGVALVGANQLYWFTRKLEFQGSVELPDESLAAAVDPHGDYAAVSLASGLNLIFSGPRKPLHHFDTTRPLVRLDFLVYHPAIVGVADYGLLCCHSFNGRLLWQEKLWANAGDVTETGSGDMILVACFNHGIQCFDEDGTNVGSYQLEGTACRVSTSFLRQRIAAATLERQLCWLNADGQMLWSATAPEDVSRVLCDPQGHGLVCGFQSGRILRLDWNLP